MSRLLALLFMPGLAQAAVYSCYSEDRLYHYEGEAPTKGPATSLAMRACYTQSPTPANCKFDRCDPPRIPDPRTVTSFELQDGRRILVCTPALLRAGICSFGKKAR